MQKCSTNVDSFFLEVYVYTSCLYKSSEARNTLNFHGEASQKASATLRHDYTILVMLVLASIGYLEWGDSGRKHPFSARHSKWPRQIGQRNCAQTFSPKKYLANVNTAWQGLNAATFRRMLRMFRVAAPFRTLVSAFRRMVRFWWSFRLRRMWRRFLERRFRCFVVAVFAVTEPQPQLLQLGLNFLRLWFRFRLRFPTLVFLFWDGKKSLDVRLFFRLPL